MSSRVRPKICFAIPGDVGSLTGGYAYDRRVLALLPECGFDAAHLELPAGFPFPSEQDIRETLQMFAVQPGDAVLLIDGLAFGALPAAALAQIRQKTVALVHHPLGYEAGLSAAQSRSLIELERTALAHADHIIVTSGPTRETLVSDFSIAGEKITVAQPGTDAARRASGSGDAVLTLLSVGSLTPRKAFDVLIAALAELPDFRWRLQIVGSGARAPQTAAALSRQIESSGVADRIALLGELQAEELASVYARADVFVLPSLYEGYGMVLAEAMACGLPILCTTGGAAASTVPDGAGLKVAPGDVGSLREALRRLMEDAPLRARMAEASWRAGQGLPQWRDTARLIARAIGKVCGELQ